MCKVQILCNVLIITSYFPSKQLQFHHVVYELHRLKRIQIELTSCVALLNAVVRFLDSSVHLRTPSHRQSVCPRQGARGSSVIGSGRIINLEAFSNLLGGEYVSPFESLPVYVVVLSGPFFMENILVPTGTKIPTANQVVEVFDAQTGNALLWGIYA
jgi:hypothetical protein